MKSILFVVLSALFLASCGNDYKEYKEKRDRYIQLVSTYKALNQNSETARIEYNDSIHKYTMLLNELN